MKTKYEITLAVALAALSIPMTTRHWNTPSAFKRGFVALRVYIVVFWVGTSSHSRPSSRSRCVSWQLCRKQRYRLCSPHQLPQTLTTRLTEVIVLRRHNRHLHR